MLRLIALFLLCACLPLRAEQATVPVPDPPELPPRVQSGEPMEPDITIIRRGEEVIEEYRINNRLYMVKIKPVIGPPYYLVDTNGDGNLDVRRSDNERGLQIPQWVLFSW
ncbi:DUF2782 domain-containing protein [Candidatus Methylocalor cossyra]|uniref:DUF2782 domain-containing protein n=1 Tax=Candidatus Methylocalor cossyra TaxID=3108543 RepID=A0ABM9NKY3_9GAMM